MGNFRDRTNERIGRLVATSYYHKQIGKRKRIYWHCRCDCGNTVEVEAGNLFRKVRSCGCLQQESRGKSSITHGLSGSRTHKIWKGMRKRCNNSNASGYQYYGGRGIKVCKRWDDFSLFIEDMGEAPPDMSIERINGSLGYSPENCKWADHRTQANNQRGNVIINHNGESLTVSQWADKYNIPYQRLWQRLYKLGWEFSRAIKD